MELIDIYINEDKIIRDIGKKRYEHSLRVMKLAEELAEIYGVDKEKAKIAGYYHDCGKYEDKSKLLKWANSFDIINNNSENISIELIHANLGAEIARKYYGVCDRDILNAIKYHTTGRKNMSYLEKIIYIADYTEPKRNFPGVDRVRDLAYKNLDEALLYAANNTINYLINKNLPISIETIEMRNQIIENEILTIRRNKMINLINTEKAPAAVGPYSQAVGVENLIYTSGQLPIDMSTGELVIDDIKEATKASMDNLIKILEEAGSDLDHLIKTTIFVTDIKDFDAINQVYGTYFSEHKPARSLIQVAKLPKGANIEIEGIAVKK